MSITNHERVGRALNLLLEGLYPFIEREMTAEYNDRWMAVASATLPDNYVKHKDIEAVLKNDLSALLIIMWERWNDVFKKTLGQTERTLVSELRATRNDWAHTPTFSTDDTYRALDSVVRLLNAISAPEASLVEKQKQELLRLKYEEQTRHQTRRLAVAAVEGTPMAGLKPWRQIATPHPDVASGRYQQAEFAADLWQVYLDEGSDEYRDPTEFYRRTYLTEGLQELLKNALRRLHGLGGDPVIELQTNFGGGKTHAMLALYHLCQALSIADLPGTESIFQAVGMDQPPQNVNVAVLVGNKLQPSGIVPYGAEGAKRPVINTLWGELAWQLGGAEGYEMVRRADETSTNPGDTLKALFNRFSPCLILIDEWVAYARQLHEKTDLAGGSFDTQFTFAQTLSESAKNAKNTLLVVSIPSSNIEIGGDRGKEALERLKNAIGRVESPWRPASAEESFEIVRRRLFQPTTDPALFVQRDAVIKAFMDMYRAQNAEFPSECKEADYERRMKEAYPIHPELFDRLYTDWSALDKFQRTRGVLRLMAKVIHSLWERNDQSLMIMPAHVPMDDLQVQSELTRYLEDNWIPIIDKDVDGANSLPLSLDANNPNLGRYSACRRVARTIYMGSAPTLRASTKGLEERRIKLGCVQPGENVAIFSDALRRLKDQGTFIYFEGNRYWIATQPNVNRIAQERAEQLLNDRDPVWEEIIRRLKADKHKGEFSAIHVAPDSTADIPDDSSLGVRLVVLAPQYPHIKGRNDSPARQWVEGALHSRGSSPRYYKNTLLFLAPSKDQIDNFERHTAKYLAWKTIVEEHEKGIFPLDAQQLQQATNQLNQSEQVVETILRETYQWLLIPHQPDAQGQIEWKETRLGNHDSPILQASRKAVYEGDLLTNYAVDNLKLEVLDRFIWTDRDHIDLKQLWEYLTQYLYLPRLKNQDVFLKSVREGVASPTWADYFAYATGFDDTSRKYSDIQVCTDITPSISTQSLLVKPDIAKYQIVPPDGEEKEIEPPIQAGKAIGRTEIQTFRRFYGNVYLDPLRINRDVSTIVTEVVQHLTSLPGTKVTITLEIEAEGSNGIPQNVVLTVTENCRTLKFTTYSFEQS